MRTLLYCETEVFGCLQENCNFLLSFFFKLPALIFLCFVFQLEECFDLYLLYIFSVTFIRRIVGLIKTFLVSFFFPFFGDFGVALRSHDCLAFVRQRGCAAAAAAVRLGTCASEPACARVFSIQSSPLPPSLSFSSSTRFIHKMQQHLTAIFTLASSC